MTEIEDKEGVARRLLAQGHEAMAALARVLIERGWSAPIPIRALADDGEFREYVKHGPEIDRAADLRRQLTLVQIFQVEEGVDLLQIKSAETQAFHDVAGEANFRWMGDGTKPHETISALMLLREIRGEPLKPSAAAYVAEFINGEAERIVINIRASIMWPDMFTEAGAECDRAGCENPPIEGRQVCEIHWSVCCERGCENGWPSGTRSSSYCDEHRRSCSDCHSEVRVLTDGKCNSCRKGQIDGYGHTHPEMWLGGPLPDVKYRGRPMQSGYYIGFELEIGTGDPFPNSVRDWAKEHMGDSGALECKEDSSVEGYEIASQPMTPEFFESMDWENFFKKLNQDNPTKHGANTEPYRHGLHVHIGRIAFRHSMTAMAAFAYMIDLQDNLARIGRRSPYHYCKKVEKRVSTAAVSPYGRATKQYSRLRGAGFYADRDAINFANEHTIEIRAFKSTRQAKHFTRAVRWVYLTAEYIRDLQERNLLSSPKHLTLRMMKSWMREHHPDKMVGLFPRGT